MKISKIQKILSCGIKFGVKENFSSIFEELYLEKDASGNHMSWTNILARGFSFKYHRVSKNKNLWKIRRFIWGQDYREGQSEESEKRKKKKNLENQKESNQIQPAVNKSAFILGEWKQISNIKNFKLFRGIWSIPLWRKLLVKTLKGRISRNIYQIICVGCTNTRIEDLPLKRDAF